MNTNEFKSHINDTILHTDLAPKLSAPYLHVEDCKDAAPARALILLDTVNGSYQHIAIGAECVTYKHVRALVNGLQFVTDLCAVAYRMDGKWERWQD